MAGAQKFVQGFLAKYADWILLAVGILFRLARFIAGRALWYDEILLADNIVHRSIADLLFKKLDYWQAAPAGFLLLERLCVDAFGPGERSLRLVPLVAGIAAMVVFRALALRMLRRPAALLAIALFACLGPLIYYASEVKQYSSDAAFAVAILLCAAKVADGNDATRGGSVEPVSPTAASPTIRRGLTCFLLPWYSGGGLRWGSCRSADQTLESAANADPHPSPPPEYQGRG
jgi:hypothetical protein